MTSTKTGNRKLPSSCFLQRRRAHGHAQPIGPQRRSSIILTSFACFTPAAIGLTILKFHYVVTEYAGEVLSEILPERPLTPAEVKEMLGPIIDALTYLHQKGLVHGRLKPSNIMVVDDQLKLSVENIRGASAIPKPPQMLDIYDAPEGTFIKVSPASDIWSLGVTHRRSAHPNSPGLESLEHQASRSCLYRFPPPSRRLLRSVCG